MDVSIIIVNYHTAGLIIDCLRSVYEKTEGIEFEVIIVDNASGDGYEETIASEFPGKDIKFITLEENVGFGRANNAGFEIAQGRNLLCLNPDTILINNAVKILSDYLDDNPDVGACGGNLYDEKMQPALSFRRMLPGIKWELNELLHLWIDRIQYGKNHRFNFTDRPIEVGYISGADIMIPRRVVKETGGFSPDFFMYYEETDLCCRIHRMGLRVVSVPAAEIQHLEGGSFDTTTINYGRIERSEIGRMTYLKRNLSPTAKTITDLVYRVFLWSRAVLKKDEGYRYRLTLLNKLTNE